jgi:hypothetical protein
VIVDQNFTYSNLLDALISLKIVKIELKIEIFKKKNTISNCDKVSIFNGSNEKF